MFELFFAIGMAAVLIFAFLMWLKEDHEILKYLGWFVVLTLILLLPKAALDNADYCEVVVNSTTLTATTNTTSYTYVRECFANDNNTAEVFYNIVNWFIRFFVGYLLVLLIYHSLYTFSESARMKIDGLKNRMRGFRK